MKFKIGDKVVVIKDVDEHKIGDIHIIESLNSAISKYDYKFEKAGYIAEENIKKLKKKDKMKILEKEISELKLTIKKIAEILEGVK